MDELRIYAIIMVKRSYKERECGIPKGSWRRVVPGGGKEDMTRERSYQVHFFSGFGSVIVFLFFFFVVSE